MLQVRLTLIKAEEKRHETKRKTTYKIKYKDISICVYIKSMSLVKLRKSRF